MDSYISFGRILKQIRTNSHLTQEELANGIISLSQYKRIESDKNNPSFYLLDLLSNKLNVNLFDIYRNTSHTATQAALDFRSKFNSEMRGEGSGNLKEILDSVSTEVIKSDRSIEQIYLYGQALLIKDQYEPALEYITRALHLEDKNISSDFESIHNSTARSNEAMCCYSFLVQLFAHNNELGKAKQMCDKIWELLNFRIQQNLSFYTSDNYMIKFYSQFCFSAVGIYLRDNDNEHALLLVNKGIDFCVENKTAYNLPRLLWRKVEVLLTINQPKEAKHTTSLLSAICEIYNKPIYIERVNSMIEEYEERGSTES